MKRLKERVLIRAINIDKLQSMSLPLSYNSQLYLAKFHKEFIKLNHNICMHKYRGISNLKENKDWLTSLSI